MSSIQELVSIGEKIGLKGEALQKFVTEQQALAREVREKEREEREKEREAEKEKRECELKREEMRVEVELKRIEASKDVEAGSIKSEREEEEEFTQGRKLRGPKLASFDESKDDMDSYIHRFEQYAALQGWRSNTWAVYLAALLKGRALDVYARLPPEEATDYAVKEIQ